MHSSMNSSMFTADRLTHLKIVVVALVAGVLIAGGTVASRLTDYSSMQASAPVIKAGKPIAAAVHETKAP